MNWVDTLRLASTSKSEIEERVHIEGWDLIANAQIEGTGILLLGLHLGNIDVVGQIVAARGYRMTVPVEPVKPEKLFKLTQSLRQSFGIKAVPAPRATRPLIGAIKKGEIVGIMADRNLGEAGIEVDFFGRPAIVSRGPAWLATRTNAVVVMGVGLRTSGGTYRAAVSGPLAIQRTGDEQADVQANAQTIISSAETRIRQHPEQWAMFAPVWSTEPRRGRAKTAVFRGSPN